jgi:hypothetical protein
LNFASEPDYEIKIISSSANEPDYEIKIILEENLEIMGFFSVYYWILATATTSKFHHH